MRHTSTLQIFITKYNSFYYLTVFISALFVFYVAGTALSLSLNSTSIPTSDYFRFLIRYERFLYGDIDAFDLLLAKHLDHNHFLVYLFSLVDLIFWSGSLFFLWISQQISNLLYFSVWLYIAWLTIPNKYLSLVAIVFCASQIFSMYGMEVWIFPFQFVLASFRLLFVFGFLIFYNSLFQSKSKTDFFYHGLLILLVASLSHGAGILIPVAVVAAVTVAIYFMDVKLSRLKFIGLGLFILLFIAHSIYYPSQTGFLEILKQTRLGDLLNFPLYLSFLLGHSLAWSAEHSIQILSGMFGIMLYLFLLIFSFTQEIKSKMNILLLILGGFYLGSAVLIILLNMGYADFRGVNNVTLEYFLASRYIATTSGFWISTLLSFLIFTNYVTRKTIKLIVRGAIAFVFTASSAASVLNSEVEQEGWSNTLQYQLLTERYLRSWGDTKKLSIKEFSDRFYIPVGLYNDAVESLEFLKMRHLSVFSPSISGIGGLDKSPLYITDVNWDRGVSREGNVILIANTKENIGEFLPGVTIHFSSGSRIIQTRNTSGVYMQIKLSGETLNADLDGFPNPFTIDASTIQDAFYLTDRNWNQGLARRWAGFFVPNSEEFTREYVSGRFVRFSSGEMREIIRTEPSGPYLNVFLKGNPLDPEKVGLPGSYSAVDHQAD